MSSRRALLPLALLLSLSLLLAACGSDDSGDEAADDTTTTAVDDETSTTSAGDDETTTTAAEAEPEETGEPSEPSAEGAMPSIQEIEALDDFCSVWNLGETADLFADGVTSPAAMQQAAQAMNALLAQGVATAPDQIKADFTAMASSIQDFYAILADYQYDMTALSQAASTDPELAARMEAIYSPELETQLDNVDAWVAANC